MAVKRLFIDIQDDLFDLWNLVSAERGPDDYNEVTGQLEYLLIINATAVSRDVREKTYHFKDCDERDNTLFAIKEALLKNPNIFFLGETDGSMNDDELKKAGYVKNRNVVDEE